MRQWHTAISRIYHHPFIRIYISHTKCFLCYYLNVSNYGYPRHIIELYISFTVIFPTAGQLYCCTKSTDRNETHVNKLLYNMFVLYDQLYNRVSIKLLGRELDLDLLKEFIDIMIRVLMLMRERWLYAKYINVVFSFLGT